MSARLLVLSSLFPTPSEPGAGPFVRERMFRVARRRPITVVTPRPWFPGQGLIRRWHPDWRIPAPRRWTDEGVEVLAPRFPSPPGVGRRFDGASMARAVAPLVRERLARGENLIVDAHFGFPEGEAAWRMKCRFGVPAIVTLRGTEVRHAADPVLGPRLARALQGLDHVIAVSESLRQVALDLGVPPERTTVVGNGVDTQRFRPLDRREARRRLGLGKRDRVLITVGGLVERKGFHRVMEVMPALSREFPDLRYLVVGGPCREGDWSERLRSLAGELGIADRVHFTGPLPPDELSGPLSAADLFVLATRNEGWANVILESMACGTPVLATDVGGNREVVADESVGATVPFGDARALRAAIAEGLRRTWDRDAIRAYAEANDWEERIGRLEEIYGVVQLARMDVAQRGARTHGR